MSKFFVLLALLFTIDGFTQSMSAAEILERSIRFHDPNGRWKDLQASFSFEESRPNGKLRKTKVDIDNPNGFFKLNRDGQEIHGMAMDSCFTISEGIDCDRAKKMRDYYLYLWGLPMKLKDKGTVLDAEYEEAKLEGVEAFVLRVAYEKDTWYFYIRREDFALIAYKFYQDPAETKGEFISTEGAFEHEGIKYPNARSWYTLPDNKFLGTDRMVDATSLQDE